MLPFLPDPPPSLVLVGGKGGVGKTTLSAATAVYLANEDGRRRVVVASSDPAHSLGDVLGIALGAAPTAVPGFANLRALHIDAGERWSEFVGRHRAGIGALLADGLELDAPEVERVLRFSMPGLDEIMALLEVERIARSEADVLVVDTAPTGHTIRLLELPGVLPGWLKLLDTLRDKQRYIASRFGGSGENAADRFLKDLLKTLSRVRTLLCDRTRCRFVPVMLQERVVAEETERLVEQLRRLRIPCAHVVVNRCSGADGPAEFLSLRVVRYAQQPEEVVGPDALLAFARQADRATNAPVLVSTKPGKPVTMRGPDRLVQVVLVAGKGGVGKSTIASAMALGLTRAPRLLMSTDPAHSLGDVLDRPIGHDPAEVAGVPGLWAQQADPFRILDELKEVPRREVGELFGALAREEQIDLPFERHVLQAVLDLVPPGLDEAMALASLSDYLERRQFDLIVVDTAPTGHLLRLLETPDLARQWLGFVLELFLKRGLVSRLPRTRDMLRNLARRLQRLKEILTSTASCHAVIVATEGRVVLAETGRLWRALTEMGVGVRGVVLNRAGEGASVSALRRAMPDLPRGCEVVCVPASPKEPRGLERLAGLLAVLG